MRMFVTGIGNVTVDFQHNRCSDGTDNKFSNMTLCIIYTDKTTVGMGFAKCMRVDQFRKSEGRKIALTKAVKTLPREQRSEIWNQYWETVGMH